MRKMRISILCLVSTLIITSCVKNDYDTPPDTSQYDPMLEVTRPISDLTDTALSMAVGAWKVLDEDIIYGVVIGDDHSGNIYKQIIIQDSSNRGIAIILDKTTLYGDYPAGRKLYIKLKGLILMNYHGLPEIVYSVDADGGTVGIPSSLINNYITKASFPNFVEPTVVTMENIFSSPSSYLNTLIKLENIQFDSSSANKQYSSSDRSTTRIIRDCPFNGSIGMYNSSYSKFHTAITPNGKGTIVGILSMYNNPQFLLRDTSDVRLTGARDCE